MIDYPIKPQPKKSNKSLWFFMGFITVILFAFAVFVNTYLPEVTDCDEQINASFINGSQLGYLNGIYDTSQLVLTQGMLPYFNEEGEIEYLNLTKELE